jgi:uncharacterized protein YjbI with pentapeptide repeats
MSFRRPTRSLALHLLAALALLGLSTGTASAASYELTNGSLVDPILDLALAPHPYAGPNLAPNVDLTVVGPPSADLSSASLVDADLRAARLDGVDFSLADLTRADLVGASLVGSVLTGANLSDVVLDFADLSGAQASGVDLTGAVMTNANLAGADLRGAILSGVIGLGNTAGTAIYDASTDFSNASTGGPGSAPFDPAAAGWSLVPEPGSALLIGLGLTALASNRRR